MEPKTHIAGIDVILDGVRIVQRCAACGEALVDVDTRLTMVVGEGKALEPVTHVATWKTGALVRVEGVNPVHSALVELSENDKHFNLPEDFCTRAEKR